MLVDGGSAGGMSTARAEAVQLEQLGYDLFSTAEVDHDALLPLALAAQDTTRIGLGTGILVAFGRTPMATALPAWDLQAFSGGRVLLGLGSQVKPHIERRFSMPWSHPAARMREYVAALHAIWGSWQHGTRLDFAGDFYTHTLMTPMFDPGPLPAGPPKVLVAAVGERMTAVAAEVADGVLLHGFTTERYSREVSLPLVERTLEAAGRARSDFQVRVTPFLVAETDGPRRETAIRETRKRIAFYASTPSYRPVMELHGWGDLQTELWQLSKAGQWDTMGELVDDEVLDAFAVVAEPDRLVDRLGERLVGVADRVGLSLPADVDPDWHADVVRRLHLL